ncbi:hypothetical protein [Methylocucumis oryzae]|uniref:Uncharacterized protein n=1 Tax=Methylocucumis oryzae TaxID=1632867 RepID=A0A0F3IQ27_9GAMM|nr:hypothetical protein [Methylocucumis oryzae]KJV07674.1 hypothetical protein VZ94_03155 [Methylocucumis oryzae]
MKDFLETRVGTLENNIVQNIQQLATVGSDLKYQASTHFENINADLLAFRTEIQQQLILKKTNSMAV